MSVGGGGGNKCSVLESRGGRVDRGGRRLRCRLSSGVLEFGRLLRVTGDGGERGEAGAHRRRGVALHEHGVQARHLGREEGVDAVEHGEEV